MTSVWYIGDAFERRMSAADWAAAEAPGNETVWNQNNGWSVSSSAFTAEQLDVLQISPDFLTNQADGPRTTPVVNSPGQAGNTDAALAQYYYIKMAEVYDQFLADYDPEAAVNIPDGTILRNKFHVDVIAELDSYATTAEVTNALVPYAQKASPTFTGTVSGITKAMVGLGSVDNTADSAKPVSTAQQSALNLKANLASPTFTGTVGGITKTMVGLGSVDNTTDAAKPVSTAQQNALDLKANLASPTFTGTVAGITKTMVGLGSVDNTSDTAKPVSTAQQAALNLKANIASPTFTGTVGGVTAAMVGLGNVNNTADTAKPVSTAQQAALDLKQSLSARNVANGYAGLDSSGLIPTSLIPGTMDDVLEYANAAALPVTGVAGKLYTTLDNNRVFRWGGSAYVEISPSPGSTDVVPEGSLNLYYTQARADARASAALAARMLSAGTGLVGGGTLAADRSFALSAASIASLGKADTAVQGDDVRLADTRTPTDNTVSTIKIINDAVTSVKLDPTVRTSLGKADTAVQGTDARLSDTRTPTDNTVSTAKLVNDAVTSAKLDPAVRTSLGKADTSIQPADHALKAPVESPTFTGLVTTPAIKITGGTPGSGYLLTSDADGDATWQAPTGGVADGAIGTVKLADDAVTGVKIADYAIPYDICYMAAGKNSTRAVGTLDNPLGLKLSQDIQINSVTYRCVTADASGDLIVEIHKNGVAVAGSSQTLPAANQVSGIVLSGLSINFATGDVLTVNVTGIGTTPGKGLTADIKAKARNL